MKINAWLARRPRCAAVLGAVLGAMLIPVLASAPAEARGWVYAPCCARPVVVVGPPVVVRRPHVWIRAHWSGPYWVPGHWR